MSAFTAVPVLDYSLSKSEETKAAFLDELKHALLEVGFLYIKNTGIDEELVEEVIRLGKAFFDLPEDEKLRLEMKNSTDWREQIDISTELSVPGNNEPRYRWLRGPNQWPSESLLPKFKETYTKFMDAMGDLSEGYLSLVAEAIGLEKDAFVKYYEGSESASGTRRQDRLKVVRYPDAEELKDKIDTESEGGFGGTFVVAMGKGLEAITGGVCVATTHRVISPKAGEGSRFSIPFFQGVSYDQRYESMDIPDEVKKLKREIVKGDAEMSPSIGTFGLLGDSILVNRVRSHPDVGAKHYPEILAKIRSQEAATAIDEAPPSEKAATKYAESLLVVPGPANTTTTSIEGGDEPARKMRSRAPTIVVEKISSDVPSYGEDPGPDGSIERKEAWKMRQADAVPDVVRVIATEENKPLEIRNKDLGGLGSGLAF